ncbi:MAG: hypothetical protein JNG89_13925 [Planctomycetaceae bacterium]|nr:hypothetical protein [Planctomycetaceae bacterium]
MKRTTLAAVLLGALASGSVAADKPANNDPAKADAKSGGDLTPIITAAQLTIRGETLKSPLLLLAAAEIIADHKRSQRTAEAIQGAGTEVADGKLPDLDMQTLIDRARELAKGDAAMEAAVEAMVAQIESDGRGLIYAQGKNLRSEEINGVTFKDINDGIDQINPNGVLTIENVIFEASKPAVVYVAGDGDGDLDLWVYDDNGVLIGQDVDETSSCVVRWNPIYEGPFTLVIKNVGPIYERFLVFVNW